MKFFVALAVLSVAVRSSLALTCYGCEVLNASQPCDFTYKCPKGTAFCETLVSVIDGVASVIPSCATKEKCGLNSADEGYHRCDFTKSDTECYSCCDVNKCNDLETALEDLPDDVFTPKKSAIKYQDDDEDEGEYEVYHDGDEGEVEEESDEESDEDLKLGTEEKDEKLKEEKYLKKIAKIIEKDEKKLEKGEKIDEDETADDEDETIKTKTTDDDKTADKNNDDDDDDDRTILDDYKTDDEPKKVTTYVNVNDGAATNSTAVIVTDYTDLITELVTDAVTESPIETTESMDDFDENLENTTEATSTANEVSTAEPEDDDSSDFDGEHDAFTGSSRALKHEISVLAISVLVAIIKNFA